MKDAHPGYSTPLVIAIMAFAVVAYLFLIDTTINSNGVKKSPVQNTNTATRSTNVNEGTDLTANTNISNTNGGVNANVSIAPDTGTQSSLLQPASSLDIKRSAYFWRDGQMFKVSLSNGDVEEIFTFPTTGTVKSVAYNDQTDAIAYVTSAGDTDTLKFRYRGNDTFWRLDTITRAGPDEVQQALRYAGAQFLSNDLVLGTIGGWEGCSDHVVAIATKKILYDHWCGALTMNPAGTLFTKATVAGLGTGNEFSTATSLTAEFKSVDWSNVSGDVMGIRADNPEESLYGFVNLGFINNDQAILNIVPMNDSSVRLGVFDFAERTFKLLPDSATIAMSARRVAGKYIVGTNDQQLIVYNRETYKTTVYLLGPDLVVGKYTNVSLSEAQDGNIILRIETDYKNDEYTSEKSYSVDLSTGKYHELLFGSQAFFAGFATK